MLANATANITAYKLFFSDYLKNLPDELAKKLEFKFFASIQLRNGTTKTTAVNRMNDVNQATTVYFNGLDTKPRVFLDVAISSGVSTGEWYAQMTHSGLTGIQMTATDLTLKAHLIEINRYLRVLVQSCNFPLQFDIAGIPVRASKYGRKGYLNGEYLTAWFLKKIFDRVSKKTSLQAYLESLSKSEKSADTASIFNHQKIRIRNLNLISPSVAELGDLTFLNDDLGAENPADFIGKFDVIRAANILNIGYFSESVLIAFLQRLKERLKGAGAFLLICRTNLQGENNATLFKLNSHNKFEAVLRIGKGSEIENIVLASA